MPRTGFQLGIDIQAAPETVFDYIADFTRHGEWAANPLTIEALTRGPLRVGSRFHSQATVNGLHIDAEFELTVFERPLRLGFAGEDSTGKYEHLFSLQSVAGGTHLERSLRFDLGLRQWLMYWLLLYPVRIPAGKRALRLLKVRLEKTP